MMQLSVATIIKKMCDLDSTQKLLEFVENEEKILRKFNVSGTTKITTCIYSEAVFMEVTWQEGQL